MGLSLSKKQRTHPFPYPTTNYPPPQPYPPPGFVPGFIPAGYGQNPYFPSQPQPTWPMPEKRKKRKKSKRQPTYPNGYAPGRAQSNRVSHTISTHRSNSRHHNSSRPSTVHDNRASNSAPPPLFTPTTTGNPLASFPSPQIGHASSGRAATPFIPPLNDDDDDSSDSDDDDPPYRRSSRLDRGDSRHYESAPQSYPVPPPGQFHTLPTQHGGNHSSVQPDLSRILDPTQNTDFGPAVPRRTTSLRNPLPAPPRDLYEMSPYKSLLNLPHTTALLTAQYGQSVNQVYPSIIPAHGNKEQKKPRKGIFRAFSTSSKRPEAAIRVNDLPQPNVRFVPVFVPQGPQGQTQSQAPGLTTTTSVPPFTTNTTAPVFNNPNTSVSSGSSITTPTPPTGPAPVPPSPPAIRFDQDQDGPYAGFMNHSHHRILYQNATYPTAMHLHEALKFLEHRKDIAEAIRNCPDVMQVYPLSAKYQDAQRPDWGQVFLQKMEEVLYHKFKQHPDLRQLLMGTGMAKLIYADRNDDFWGEGPLGRGENELGKALVHVRDRLRAEGY